MKKNITFLLIGFLSLILTSFNTIDRNNKVISDPPSSSDFIEYSNKLYKKLNDHNLKFDAFTIALNGYLKLQKQHSIRNSKFLTIVDMSLSANRDRLFIIDMESQEVIHKSKVAHGRNSGGEYAKKFSNKIGSYQSSIGFFKTAETYNGKHGLSLRLDGLEFSNNNARNRAIVIHSANYVSDEFITKNGRLGRSLGCPAIPKKGYTDLVNKIKDGSIIYIYYPDDIYLKKSKLANI